MIHFMHTVNSLLTKTSTLYKMGTWCWSLSFGFSFISLSLQYIATFYRMDISLRWTVRAGPDGVLCCISLVGGTTTMTATLMRCENCENLSTLKAQGIFARYFSPVQMN